MRGRLAASVLIGVLALGLVSCTDDDAERAADGSLPTIADLQRFSGLITASLGTGDAGALEDPSPDVLADRAHLVVTGSIDAVVPGREGVDGLQGIRSVVMVIDVEDAVAGSLPDDSDDKVYVEIGLGGISTAAELDAVAPRTVGVALFLYPAPDEAFPSTPYRDPAAGRPAGQPLWQFPREHGFVLEDGRGGVLEVVPYAEHPETSLADFLPPNDQWPVPAAEPVLECADPAALDGGVGQVGQLTPPPFVETVAEALAQFVPGPAFLPEVGRVAAPGVAPEPSGYAHEVTALTVNYATYRDAADRVVAWFRLEGSHDVGWRVSYFTACREWFAALRERPWPPELFPTLECAEGEGTELIMDSDPGVRVAPRAASIEAAMDQQSLVQVIPAVLGTIPFADITPAAGYRINVSSSGNRVLGYRDEQARLVAWFWITGSETEAGWQVVGFEGCQTWYDALPTLSTP